VEENRPSRDLGAEKANIAQGDDNQDDYQYDEAHDVWAGPLGESPAPHRVCPPPKVNLGVDGDYGYDEAHDFGRS
jgi:hypothetical protein